MEIEQRIRAKVLAYAQIIVRRGRLAEARADWENLLNEIIMGDPFYTWIVNSELTRKQLDTWLDEALKRLE